jgi:hypothetical protein
MTACSLYLQNSRQIKLTDGAMTVIFPDWLPPAERFQYMIDNL